MGNKGVPLEEVLRAGDKSNLPLLWVSVAGKGFKSSPMPRLPEMASAEVKGN